MKKKLEQLKKKKGFKCECLIRVQLVTTHLFLSLPDSKLYRDRLKSTENEAEKQPL